MVFVVAVTDNSQTQPKAAVLETGINSHCYIFIQQVLL